MREREIYKKMDVRTELDEVLEVLEREQLEDEKKMEEARRAKEMESAQPPVGFEDILMLDSTEELELREQPDHDGTGGNDLNWCTQDDDQETMRTGDEGQEDLHESRHEPEEDPKAHKLSLIHI